MVRSRARIRVRFFLLFTTASSDYLALLFADPAEEARKLAEKEAEAEMVSEGAAGADAAAAATEETKDEL